MRNFWKLLMDNFNQRAKHIADLIESLIEANITRQSRKPLAQIIVRKPMDCFERSKSMHNAKHVDGDDFLIAEAQISVIAHPLTIMAQRLPIVFAYE